MRKKQRQVRDYLLQNSVQPELEKEFLTSDELFEELLIQEDEIIDQYVRWQNSFLATKDRHWKLEFAQMFNRYVAERTAN